MTLKRSPHVRVVLVGTTHPGNIGSAARAMKTMGVTELVLVAPEFFPHSRATALATTAADVLERARVVPTLREAISDCHIVIGTSAKSRSLPWPQLTAREVGTTAAAKSDQHIALVFGRERDGLSNDELQQCHYHVHIPTDDECRCLNLAQAVQVLCYEVMMGRNTTPAETSEELAPHADVQCFYERLFETLATLQFFDPKQPKRLRERLMRLFNKAQLETNEVNILQGILTAVRRKVSP